MATSLRVQALIVLVLGCVASLGLRKRVAGASALPMRWREKLGDVRVWALMAMAFFAAASRFAQLLCFPAFARASGLTDASATNVLYALGATFLAGSIAGGLVADRSGYVGGIGLSELVMGFFTLVLWAPSSSPAPMYIYAVLFGLCSGALAALLPAAVAQLLGAPRLASSLGLVIAVSMPAILITAPAAIRFLALADQKRSTAWLAAVSGVLSLIAGFIGLTLPLLQRRHLHKEVQREAADAFPVPPSRPSA
ncbi:major facilitator superfamily domain-containing protein [Coemansia spiralis]|nr:major facilitator superfamily domain-containing protein [Coemansia spiralis]